MRWYCAKKYRPKNGQPCLVINSLGSLHVAILLDKADCWIDTMTETLKCADLIINDVTHFLIPDPIDPILEQPITWLRLSVRVENILKAVGIKFVKDLVDKTEYQVSGIPKCGKSAIKEIKTSLSKIDLKFRNPDIDDEID